MKENLKKLIEKVKNQLNKNGIEWELGTETGWNENSLIFDGGDCKILLYVKEDEKEKLFLDYYDLFDKGEYSPIFDGVNKETTTSHRGCEKSVKKMLKDLNLI
jgi:hypothetical protein